MTLHEPHKAGKSNSAKHLSIYALLLAAGRGSRFGGSKLEAEYRHRALLTYPLALIAAARERGLIHGGYAVIRADDEDSSRLVRDMKLEPLLNRAPERGLSFSLQIGLHAMATADGPAAALILLGDQPLVRLDVVEALISAWHAGGGTIIRPRYEASPNVPGHPALVARGAWPLIRELRGDAGFGSLGSRLTETIVEVSGHNPDVDTPGDLQALQVHQ